MKRKRFTEEQIIGEISRPTVSSPTPDSKPPCIPTNGPQNCNAYAYNAPLPEMGSDLM
jgi:hypothetical protein